MSLILLRAGILLAAATVLAACSNGGGASDDDSADRNSNTLPNLQLNDGDVLGGDSSIIRIPAGDDTGIVRVSNNIVRQGSLPECAGLFADDSLVATSLVAACLLDQPSCSVTFQPVGDALEVIPPPLFAPIGVEYDVSLVDRDGSITEPVRAVFCFDVGLNAPPVTAPDTFQLTYPSRIERTGVRYDDRCFKADGSQGVLANDEDDEHITNTCLRAELVELPTYASNLSTFRSTFGADGSFVYEAFNELPPEDSSGLSIDTFTYRVTDGVNPVSDPVRVEIVFVDSENAGPVAVDDSFTINEDSGVQELAVLNNDFDPDALPLNVIGISNGPGNGVANIRNGALIEYRPRADFIGQDNFTYTVQDSGGLTVNANVTINVVNVNDAPVAVNDNISVNRNASVVVQVLANDSDAEGDTLSVESVASPLRGTATVISGSTVRYTPDAGFFGPDSFEYTITDGSDRATATVVVNVVFVNVAPVIGVDQISVPEDTSGVFNLLANDADGDGDALSIVSVGDASNGVVALLSSGEVRYTPDDGFSGSDGFSYTVSDGTVETTGQVTVNVSSVNDAPNANDDSASTDEDNPVVIDVLSNDTDPDGDDLTVTSISNARSGSATINSDNTVTFVPADSFSGTAGFSYVIDDGNGGTDTGAVTVLVSDTNAAPVASDDNASTSEETSVVIEVLSNDSDPDGDSLSVTNIVDTRSGSATINANNTVTFVPADSFSGTAGFSYVIDDGNGGTDTGAVTVLVSDTNAAPVAVDDTRSTEEGDPVGVQVLQNDSDPDGDSLTLSVLTQPSNGSASITAQGEVIVYSPDAGFSGTDSFTYQISDGNGGVAVATVTVTVNSVASVNVAPQAQADAVQVSQGGVATIAVLANDSDPDGDTLTVSIVTPPSDGTATVQTDNTITYTPDATFAGVDVLTYSVADGNGGTDTATVTFTVAAVVVNNPPSAGDDSAQATQGVVVNFNVLANDSDTDGDPLTVTVTTPPANGVATVLPDNRIQYTSDASFSGSDSIGYTVDDGNGGTDTAVVSITVASSNSSPVAAADSAVTPQDTAIDIDVLGNDIDTDGDALTVTIDTGPTGGTATVAADNTVTYVPTTSFSGPDSFVYEISDGIATDTATVSITVTPTPVVTNQAPVAENDTVVIDQDQSAQINVLSNDTDLDGDPLTVTIDTGPTGGTATVAADNTVTYVPTTGFSGPDNFVYEISDGIATDTATVSITVTPTPVVTNQAPVAANDTVVIDQDQSAQINVLSNDTDLDGDALTVTIDTGPTGGTATVDADNTVTYVPTAGFSGPDSFVYEISDGIATDTATVSITVTAVDNTTGITTIQILTGEAGVGGDQANFALQIPDGSTEVPIVSDILGIDWVEPALGAWIAPRVDLTGAAGTVDSQYPLGSYIYTHNFDLPSTEGVSMSGVWASDDGITITLNGNQLLQTANDAQNWDVISAFSADESELIAGTNTIVFTVENLGGPTGLYVNAMIGN